MLQSQVKLLVTIIIIIYNNNTENCDDYKNIIIMIHNFNCKTIASIIMFSLLSLIAAYK